jgi:MFS family permease
MVCSFGGLISTILLIFVHSFAGIAATSALRGFTLTVTIASVNSAIGVVFEKNKGKWSSSIHSFFGIGLIASPLIGIVFSYLSISWKLVWGVLAIGWLLILLMIVPLEDLYFRKQATTKRHALPPRKPGLPIVLLVMPLFLAFVNIGTEVTVLSWAPTYLELISSGIRQTLIASLILSVFIFFGRRLSSLYSDVLGLQRYYIVSLLLLIIVSACIMLFRRSGIAVFFFVSLYGIGMSGIYPVLIARISDIANKTGGRLFSAFEMVGTCGGAALPYLVGRISTLYPQFGYPAMVALGSFLLLVFSVVFERQQHRYYGNSIK